MPTLEQLDGALAQSARQVPAIARLGGGTVPQTDAGHPWRILGGEAVVYQLRQPTGRVLALRCPLSDTFDQRQADRYRALSAYLAHPGTRSALPLASSVAYVEDGLTLAGADFRSAPAPVVAMDWVMGPTLLSAVDRACRADDRPYLAALADAWRALAEGLDRAEFAHGDLAADNVLIESGGRIILVDYDTCHWPGADLDISQPGTAGYAHPHFDPRVDPRYRDAYSTLVTYVALRALATRPDLRQRGGDGPTAVGGALLFSAVDLANPEGSTIFGLLRGLGQPAVEALAQTLRGACKAAPHAVPSVAEWGRIADQAGQSAPRQGPSRSAAPRGPIGPLTAQRRQELATRLNSLLLTGDEEAAYRYWYRSGLHQDEVSRVEIGPRMADLERRRAIRLARQAAGQRDTRTFLTLWDAHRLAEAPEAAALVTLHAAAKHREALAIAMSEALGAGDAVRVADLWPALRGDTLISESAIAVADTLQRHFGAAIAAALREGDDATVVAAIQAAEGAGVAPSPLTRKALRQARDRLRARAALAEAVARDDRDTLAQLAMSGTLAGMGPLDPATERSLDRALAWPALSRALAADDDAALRAAWDEALFGDDHRLGPEDRQQVERALRRLAWLDTVRAALRGRRASILSEALRNVPAGAADRLSAAERRRLNRIAGRDLAAGRLALALATGDEAAVGIELDAVTGAGGSAAELLDWAGVPPGNERDALVRALRDVSQAEPMDHGRLARLLAAARAVTSAESGMGQRSFATFRRQALRAGYVARYRDALAAEDPVALALAAEEDRVGAAELLDPIERAMVAEAIARVSTVGEAAATGTV